jgi:hypothetical protein
VTDIDDALRRWAQEQTDDAPDVHVDPDRFGTGRRRPWLAPLAAAAAVLVVAAGVLVVRPWESGSRTFDRAIPLDRHSVTPPSVSPSASTRESVFHGLAIDVPKSWPDNATWCGTPTRSTLIYPSGSTAACAIGRAAGITSVEWGVSGEYQGLVTDTSTTEVHIGGVRGTRTVGVLGPQGSTIKNPLHVVRITVPKLSAQVEITSPSTGLADRLAATLHVVTHDQFGCAIRSSVRTLSDAPTPTRPGSDHILIPGTPSAISVCWYEHGFLEHGNSLDRHDSAAAVRLVNALPRGLSIADPKTYLPAVCQPNNHFSDLSDVSIFVFHVSFPTGKPLTLVSRTSVCGLLGITNGRRNGQFRTGLWEFLSRHVGGPGVIPGRLLPVH